MGAGILSDEVSYLIDILCVSCGFMGHKIIDCYFKLQNPKYTINKIINDLEIIKIHKDKNK